MNWEFTRLMILESQDIPRRAFEKVPEILTDQMAMRMLGVRMDWSGPPGPFDLDRFSDMYLRGAAELVVRQWREEMNRGARGLKLWKLPPMRQFREFHQESHVAYEHVLGLHMTTRCTHSEDFDRYRDVIQRTSQFDLLYSWDKMPLGVAKHHLFNMHNESAYWGTRVGLRELPDYDA